MKNYNINIKPRKILISRTDKIGDIILTLPLITETKRQFPESEINFLTNNIIHKLLDGYPDINKLIYFNKTVSFTEKLKLIKQGKYDVVICAYPRFELALLFFLAGIKYRIGSSYRWYSFLFNKKVYEHRKHAVKHESEYNLNLLTALSDNISLKKKYYFKYSDEEKMNLNEKLLQKNLSLDSKFVIIHPGSKGSAKDWGIENFSSYAKTFIEKFKDYKLSITGTKEESSLAKKITDTTEDNINIIDMTGFLDLRELMILIDNSSLFISNSTGPIHIAGALNKKIIGFYPNSAPMNETRWKPLSEFAVILKPDNQQDRMDKIPTEKVIEETKRILYS